MSHQLDEYKQEITTLKSNGSTNEEVLQWLYSNGINVSKSTLKTRFKTWGVRKKTEVPETQWLVDRVKHLFLHTRKSDEAIASEIARIDKIYPTTNQIREIRLRQSLHRRHNDPQVREQHRQTTTDLVQNLVLTGSGRQFGRIWTQTHLLRKLGYRARDHDIESALKAVNAEASASRRPKLRQSRLDNLLTDGPNQLWCMDGHDKLSPFGFQIYAAIDAYSRKILWFYYGNANRSKRSVLHQFLKAIKHHGVCPRYIRTDCGSETIDLCCAQFRLFVEVALKEDRWSQEELSSLKATDCYIDGPSVHNIRIEGLWRLQRDQVTNS